MSRFHDSKQSAAVLKHAIIDSYATPFASKTGSTSPGKRVAFIDGYAGPGRYVSGAEGSGAMLLRKAKELSELHPPRQVQCHFVENDPVTVARLREVAAAEGRDVDYTVSDEDISLRLPVLLEQVQNMPLFAYLDPCGLPIPMDEVASIFDRPSSGTPATEVLINLTAQLRRFAGHLTSNTPVERTLERMDEVCGGRWWRDAWLTHCTSSSCTEDQKMSAELAVVEGYAERLSERAGGAGIWVVDVRPRAGLKPLYYLIFATRHPAGMVTFGESASMGLEHWRKYQAEQTAESDLFGEAGDWEARWNEDEKLLAAEWVETLAARLTNELAKGQPFCVIDRAEQILGNDLVGLVRTKHLRAAMKQVLAAARTTTDPKGKDDLYNLTLRPG